MVVPKWCTTRPSNPNPTPNSNPNASFEGLLKTRALREQFEKFLEQEHSSEIYVFWTHSEHCECVGEKWSGVEWEGLRRVREAGLVAWCAGLF